MFVDISAGLRSAPDVVQNDFTTNDWRDLLERGRWALWESKEYILNILFQIIREAGNIKSWEDFRCRILNPLIGNLIGLGATELIKAIFKMIATAA